VFRLTVWSGRKGRGGSHFDLPQIQMSLTAVRSPPSCPVLSTPRGSIRRSLTSCSAQGLCSTPFGTTNYFPS
jgi:hypothetical protein